MTPVDIAAECIVLGYSPVPLLPRSKRCVLSDWPSLRVTEATLQIHFGEPCNIGVLMGEPSGWRVDVDLDHPLAVEIADRYLPRTGAVFGRASKPRSHRVYKVTGPLETAQHRLADGTMIAELRSTGCQTMWPGSTHPSGEEIRWDENGEPAEISPEMLTALVEAIANAVRTQVGDAATANTVVAEVTSVAGRDTGPADAATLRRAEAYLDKMEPAISGQGGHDRAYAAATAMVHGFGLTPEQGVDLLLRSYNPRCQPPWSEKELLHKVTDAATKGHDKPYRWLAEAPVQQVAVSSRLGGGGGYADPCLNGVVSRAASNGAATGLEQPVELDEAPWHPTWAGQFLAHNPELAPAVIEGILREGETLNLIAAPKTGKSMIGQALALAVATGGKWLGLYQTVPGKVLIIDNELHPRTAAFRLRTLADAMRLEITEFKEQIAVECLRGNLKDLKQLNQIFSQIKPGEFSLIVIDAFYRTLPAGVDENNNAQMAGLYNLIDRYAATTGCAFSLIHHASKGEQGHKAATDVGAGAGAQSRAADAHLVLRQHKEDGAVVLDGVVRSWAPITPTVLWFTFPTFVPDDSGLDPRDLRSPGSRKKPNNEAGSHAPTPKKVWTPAQFAAKCVGEKPQIRDDVIAAAANEGLKKTEASSLLNRCVQSGDVHRFQVAVNGPFVFSTKPMLRPVLAQQAGGEGGVCVPPHTPPERHAPGAATGTRGTHPPRPPRGLHPEDIKPRDGKMRGGRP